MLNRRYFSAMVTAIKYNPGFLSDDEKMIDRLRQSGFTKADIDEEFQNAKTKALQHIETAKRNGGRLPVVVTIFDIKTDTEETTYNVEDYLKPGTDGWLRKKILYAVNNGKSVEICAPED
jgi:hypothetical protein